MEGIHEFLLHLFICSQDLKKLLLDFNVILRKEVSYSEKQLIIFYGGS